MESRPVLTAALVDCSRRNLRLTEQGCTTLYKSANEGKAPAPWEGRAACRNCPVGAMRATGQVINPMAQVMSDLARICVRCGRTPERLIWSTYCPSCDARQREAIRRRNSKGNPPKLSSVIHTEKLLVSGKLVVRPNVIDASEAIIQISKKLDHPVAFGRRRVYWNARVSAGHGIGYGMQFELGL